MNENKSFSFEDLTHIPPSFSEDDQSEDELNLYLDSNLRQPETIAHSILWKKMLRSTDGTATELTFQSMKESFTKHKNDLLMEH